MLNHLVDVDAGFQPRSWLLHVKNDLDDQSWEELLSWARLGEQQVVEMCVTIRRDRSQTDVKRAESIGDVDANVDLLGMLVVDGRRSRSKETGDAKQEQHQNGCWVGRWIDPVLAVLAAWLLQGH